MKKLPFRWAAPWPFICAGVFLLCPPTHATDNMHFFGTLVYEACTIAPGDEELKLDFTRVVDSYLYSYGRTRSQLMPLRLIHCDTTIGKTVKITLTGTESAVLPGLLALSPTSVATGVAIGLETPEQKEWPLNVEHAVNLTDGNNRIEIFAFIQGEPDALRNRNIGHGEFTAIATFTLAYE
ncbi:fimbrial protein [Enterobacter bugandensis]|nr:fimbrial protein [Enterobacter bugandensis]EKS7120160.1 fimbrial protein [Enterobacter bugandensis]